MLDVYKRQIKNRVVMGPMGNLNMCEESGRPNDKMLQYFFARAKGGTGLLTTGLIPVSHGIDPTVTEVDDLSLFPRIDHARTVFAAVSYTHLADVFRAFVKQLAQEKGCEAEYALYEKVEHMAPEVIAEKRRIYKGVSANVDFYSGLVYSMLDLPPSLYTPIFAAARIVGWSAHRLEELKNADKIIRPAYKPLAPHREYIKLDDR